jgi:hypothetical protein
MIQAALFIPFSLARLGTVASIVTQLPRRAPTALNDVFRAVTIQEAIERKRLGLGDSVSLQQGFDKGERTGYLPSARRSARRGGKPAARIFF